MKTEILNKQKHQNIDWNKPQWVISKDTELDVIVFTDGNWNGEYFHGTSLPCSEYPSGDKSTTWKRDKFQPIPSEGLTILIKND